MVIEKQSLTQEKLKIIMERCTNFIFRLCRVILERLPHNLVIIEKLKFFSPTECLNQHLNTRASFLELPLEARSSSSW